LRGIYSIPFGCLYSRNIENMMFAGRNVSASHVAFGTLRVQGTTAVMGQAVGTAAAICLKHGADPRALRADHIGELQQQLLKDDCYIIGMRNEDPDDLALSATVVASGSMTLEVTEADEWLPMDVGRGQMISLSSQHLNEISLLMQSGADRPVALEATLLCGRFMDDFHTQQQVATAKVVIPPAFKDWINFEFDVDIDPRWPHWIRVEPASGVSWASTSRDVIGTQRTEWFDLLGRWQTIRGTHCFRTIPASQPYAAANVISGVTRPEAGPNIWISDPRQSLPQWLDLEFAQQHTIEAVYLTFDTNLDHITEAGAAPECVKDYRLLVDNGGGYRELIAVQGNYHRRRIHRFAPLLANKLRLLVEATNGASEARVYEVRVY
jgi:hypothetical protein